MKEGPYFICALLDDVCTKGKFTDILSSKITVHL